MAIVVAGTILVLVLVAVLVCMRGPMGAAAFTGAIPDSLDEGEKGPGFPIEVFNVLGAGDAFIGSFAHFFASGMEAPEALGQAARYAASSITRRGTQKSYLRAEEFVAWI